LHDVGKIGIEDRILKKPGALTPEEFEIMKTHTTKGANILRPVPQLREMLPGIELHHEALNGRGYPYGLKSDEIPLLARVIAVADTFDALTTNRPYQQAHDPADALRIIQNLSGQRLDPKAVNALLAVFQRGEIRIQKLVAQTIPLESPTPPPQAALHPADALTVETTRT
jgi:HD-GYP domain-containing protein (c-di-GMP phosphodiesterase class II)